MTKLAYQMAVEFILMEMIFIVQNVKTKDVHTKLRYKKTAKLSKLFGMKIIYRGRIKRKYRMRFSKLWKMEKFTVKVLYLVCWT